MYPVNLKENQLWIFIARTDAEVEAPILQPPDAKSRLIRKDPDAGKDSREEEEGTTSYIINLFCEYSLNVSTQMKFSAPQYFFFFLEGLSSDSYHIKE